MQTSQNEEAVTGDNSEAQDHIEEEVTDGNNEAQHNNEVVTDDNDEAQDASASNADDDSDTESFSSASALDHQAMIDSIMEDAPINIGIGGSDVPAHIKIRDSTAPEQHNQSVSTTTPRNTVVHTDTMHQFTTSTPNQNVAEPVIPTPTDEAAFGVKTEGRSLRRLSERRPRASSTTSNEDANGGTSATPNTTDNEDENPDIEPFSQVFINRTRERMLKKKYKVGNFLTDQGSGQWV